MFKIPNDPPRIWLFDYDLTLYGEEERAVLNSLDRRIALFVQNTVGVSWEESQKIRKEFWLKYGTTLAGLQACYGTKPDDFFDFIHDPSTLVYPAFAPKKRELLLSLKGRRFVFTNGRSDWSRTGCEKMGILDCFEKIIGLQELNWIGKPSDSSYGKMEEILENAGCIVPGYDPSLIVLLEDSLKNLEGAHRRGWTCVWVNPVSEERADFVDARIKHLLDLPSILATV
ncbi:MAG: HAD hydrolase-like protein [Fibrobacteraceae bacterium]|nr:HAD hydrolase-like protein [Fibrobacteraceae bacterium]